jgi:hypothetical protein
LKTTTTVSIFRPLSAASDYFKLLPQPISDHSSSSKMTWNVNKIEPLLSCSSLIGQVEITKWKDSNGNSQIDF